VPGAASTGARGVNADAAFVGSTGANRSSRDHNRHVGYDHKFEHMVGHFWPNYVLHRHDPRRPRLASVLAGDFQILLRKQVISYASAKNHRTAGIPD
jgi:hypothetical protein